jgi:ribosomal protein L21
MQYAVCEISGRQYTVKPGQTLEVDYLGDIKTLNVDKVLLMVDGEKLEIGTPYLKVPLEFEVLGSKKLEKVRVAKFAAKANYRKVKGQRREVSMIKLKEGKTVEKKEAKQSLAPKGTKKAVKKA